MEPIPRVSARVLPACPESEVLRLQEQDLTYPGMLRGTAVGPDLPDLMAAAVCAVRGSGA